MKRTLCTGVFLVFTVLTAACSFKIFEDIGSDPHPPTVQITAIIHYVAPVETGADQTPTPDKAASFPHTKSIAWDSGGFTLTPGQLFEIEIAYADAGGDIVNVTLRDRDSATSASFTPSGQTYFSGTSGTLRGPAAGLDLTGLFGRHRLEVWAEDSHLSRSEKVEFVITLVP